MTRTSFAIVGGGHRTKYFLRVASELPEQFRVAGMVVRDADKGAVLEQTWGVKTYRTLEELLQAEQVDFVVLSVRPTAAVEYMFTLAKLSIPVLTETPPAADLDGLLRLHELTLEGAKIQVAEQYQYRPMHAARLSVLQSGALGPVTQASVSVSHGYHGVSLLRKFLGIDFQPVKIRAMRFLSSIVAGPTRSGPPTEEQIIPSRRDIAWMEFGNQGETLGIYDFTNDQHRSWIRSSHVSIRGMSGEMTDEKVNILENYASPLHLEFKRVNRGEQENVEGHFTSGIILGERWVYRNPFPGARFYDDEIAVATCLSKMVAYLRGGPSFYNLREASQDHYLALLIEEAIQTGGTVVSEMQPWANSGFS